MFDGHGKRLDFGPDLPLITAPPLTAGTNFQTPDSIQRPAIAKAAGEGGKVSVAALLEQARK